MNVNMPIIRIFYCLSKITVCPKLQIMFLANIKINFTNFREKIYYIKRDTDKILKKSKRLTMH